MPSSTQTLHALLPRATDDYTYQPRRISFGAIIGAIFAGLIVLGLLHRLLRRRQAQQRLTLMTPSYPTQQSFQPQHQQSFSLHTQGPARTNTGTWVAPPPPYPPQGPNVGTPPAWQPPPAMPQAQVWTGAPPPAPEPWHPAPPSPLPQAHARTPAHPEVGWQPPAHPPPPSFPAAPQVGAPPPTRDRSPSPIESLEGMPTGPPEGAGPGAGVPPTRSDSKPPPYA
ncbi:hypothetical protein DFP72DRAFT_929948 [Ephemerocybe angulata]|uniref:Uncharacterized protein n=1 Tax=Ephemerocybe angulata TaxID=980116 RepID=A0A8H6HCW7_9AGAR|nr:hypothetical protein DFP72DRAFT_929948 [Tulosesus angulatus]